MTDEREVFTILESDSTANGVKLPARAIGDAATGNHLPGIIAVDNSGNYVLIPVKIAGQAPGNALPGMIALDSAGFLTYLNLNASGELPVSIAGGGIKKQAEGLVVGVLGSPEIAASITLTANKGHECLESWVAATRLTLWRVEFVADDGGGGETVTILSRQMTGPGQFYAALNSKNITFTTTGVGVQTLRIVGTQIIGGPTDLHGTLTIVQNP